MPPPVKPLLMTTQEINGVAKTALINRRPTAAPYVNHGWYSIPIAGLVAQGVLARATLGERCAEHILSSSTGEPLSVLARNRFSTERLAGAVASYGEVILRRGRVHYYKTPSISGPTAADESTYVALLNAAWLALFEHAGSVFSELTLEGAHDEADPSWTTLTAIYDGPTLLSAYPITVAGVPDAEDLHQITYVLAKTFNQHIANAGRTGATTEQHHLAYEDRAIDLETGVIDGFVPGGISMQTAAVRTQMLTFIESVRSSINWHFGLDSRAGVIQSDIRVDAVADEDGAPEPFFGAECAVSEDTPVKAGQTEVVVPIVAVRTGQQNIPRWWNGYIPEIRILTNLFDAAAEGPTRLTAAEMRSAGGWDAHGDTELRWACTASPRAKSGPVRSATIYGAYTWPGVAHVYRTDDPRRGGVVLFAADQNWAQSDAWLADIRQHMIDQEWMGFGPKLIMGRVLNRLVRVEATIKIQRSATRNVTDAELRTAVAEAIRAEFSDRPNDWPFWTIQSLRAALGRAHWAISSCPRVRVLNPDGGIVPEPGASYENDTVYHWVVPDDGLDLSFAVGGT